MFQGYLTSSIDLIVKQSDAIHVFIYKSVLWKVQIAKDRIKQEFSENCTFQFSQDNFCMKAISSDTN